MHKCFSVFNSHLDLAHLYWAELLRPEDLVIDATCGAGFDSLKLATLVPQGRVISIDIQELSIEKAKLLIIKNLQDIQRVQFFLQSHTDFPKNAYEHPVRLIVYNLGYLPSGDRTIKTQPLSTLISMNKASKLLAPGGALSVMCYPGHPEGLEEQNVLLEYFSSLPQNEWQVCHHTWPQRLGSPSLFLAQKIDL